MVRLGEAVFLGLVLTLSASQGVLGQEWSAAQKEVWAAELAYWNAFANREQANALAFYHDDYQGWFYGDTLPSGKASAKMAFAHSFPGTKVFWHEETPISVLVHGDVAVVHYVVVSHFQNEQGEHSSGEQRWTDTLVKVEGSWRLLGDHGGPTEAVGN